MGDLRAEADKAADRGGVPRDLFRKQIEQESGFDPNAYNATSGATGIAQIIARFHPGVDPRDPIASLIYAAAWMGRLWRQYGSYARALAAYNWGPGNVQGWDGRRETLPAETRRYLDVIMGPGWPEPGATTMPTPTFTPDTPLLLQNDDWSCFATSARMALEAWGRHPKESWIEGQLIADGIESTAQGLLDGSGTRAAAWLTAQYGDPAEGIPTIKAHSAASVSFDDVRSVAGMAGVLLGGHGWGAAGHWTFVRRYNPATDVLELGNPAGSYDGIGQTMSRQQFGRIGPCSMVVVLADGAMMAPPAQPSQPTADPRDALIAQLRADLDDARSKLGVITVDYANGLDDLVKAIRALKPSA